jgi:hypothetical protein
MDAVKLFEAKMKCTYDDAIVDLKALLSIEDGSGLHDHAEGRK